jgi:hypothetical protein
MDWKRVKFKMFGKEIDTTNLIITTDDQQAILHELPDGVAFVDAARVRFEDIKTHSDSKRGGRFIFQYTDETGREFTSPIYSMIELNPQKLAELREAFATNIENFLINEP